MAPIPNQQMAHQGVQTSTLADCLRLHAERQPQKIAYRFLKDGEAEERTLTYHELDWAARGVAALLEKYSAIGDRILLLYPLGLDFIVALCACFYSGRVAVPAYPPRPNRGTDRLCGVIQDALPAVALTSLEVKAKALHRLVNDKTFQELAVVTTDSASLDASQKWQPASLDPGMLAVLQYTSGSTSIPKGVQVTHANLMHNEELIQKAFGQTQHDIVVGWLPVYHDMGLIGNVLQPLYCGAESILMPPASFLQNPSRWLAAISRYRATTSGGPNFAYELCCNRITAGQKATLDLSSWRVAFSGAEPVRAQSLERFAAEFRDCGFRASAFVPCYGLAESTLFVSGGTTSAGPVIQAVKADALERNQVIPASLERPGSRVLVGCGGAGTGHEVCIVHPERLVRCEAGTVGEIWISGPSVANGYWNRGQETAETFEARLADTGEGPFLRTGDLGFLLGGELFITGRCKDLIIIRGRNHYPHDLEATAEKAHPALRACIGAAFSVEAEGEERLVLVHEINPQNQAEAGAVIAAVRQAIAEEHELQLYVVVLTRPGEIPRTTSGKIQRFLCRKAFLAGNLRILGEWRAAFTPSAPPTAGDVESQADDWQRWLILELARRLHISPKMIEADQPPSRYGLDSLVAVELAHEIEKKAGIFLPFPDLVSGLSIAELAAALCWQEEMAATGATVTLTPRRHDLVTFPLSHGQRALFFLYQLDRRNSAYHIYQALRIASPLDAQALARAFRLLVRRHPALRTTFKLENGNPVQELLSVNDGPILEERSCGEPQEQLLKHMAREARAPLDLEAAPPVRCILFRRSKLENYLLFAIHPIISDLWSLSLLIQELAALYESETGNSFASLPQPVLEYGDYVQWQADLLAGVEGERHWAYWRGELAGELPVLNLSADHPRPALQTFRGAAHQFRLDAGLRRRLRGLAARNGATLYSVLLAAWAVLLHRYSGQPEVIIGSPSAGRTHAAFRFVVGYFVNPVAIRASFAGDPIFETLLAQVRGKVLGALAHQDFPFPLLVEKLQPQRDPSRSALFQALFAFQGEVAGTSLGQFALGESGAVFETKALRLESVSLGEETSQFDIALQACEAQDEIVLRLQYNADLFEPQTIARMADHLGVLLHGITQNPGQKVQSLPLLSQQDMRELAACNETESSYPEKALIHELFESQVGRTPRALAVEDETRALTYAELDARANQLARHLQKFGTGPESVVAVCLNRTLEPAVDLLAVLKSGGAYLPLEPGFPQARLRFMVEDASVRVALTQSALQSQLENCSCHLLCLDRDWEQIAGESPEETSSACNSENLAYLMYTSGSTGMPKGVQITHRAVVNFLASMKVSPGLQETDVLLSVTTVSFDIFGLELYLPLICGAKVLLASTETAMDSYQLLELLKKGRGTVIGRPIANTQIYIFDSQQQPLPAGVAGELVIGGDGVARGYWRRPELTAEKFIPDPLSSKPGARLYRTGDLARLRGDGQVEFFGRLDNQVKVRGFRIELGEIEAILARHPAVSQAVVIARQAAAIRTRPQNYQLSNDPCQEAASEYRGFLKPEAAQEIGRQASSEVRLAAYLVCLNPAPASHELRAFLRQSLPEYMIPVDFVFLDALPLSPNGKLDRRALPEPDAPVRSSRREYAAPATPTEALLVEIWSEVLSVPEIGVDDNFFELGGDSIRSLQVRARALQRGLDFTVQDMMRFQTIRELAQHAGTASQAEQQLSPEPFALLSGADRRRIPEDAEDAYPLSKVQQGLLYHVLYDLSSGVYHEIFFYQVRCPLNFDLFKQAVQESVDRHPILRTSFHLEGFSVPLQIVHRHATPYVEKFDWRHLPAAAQQKSIQDWTETEKRCVLRLQNSSLVRLIVHQLKDDVFQIVSSYNNILLDGWSEASFIAELLNRYSSLLKNPLSPAFPAPLVQYRDFIPLERAAI